MNSKEHVTTHKLLLEWIHEFKSLESSDSEQHNEEVRETKRRRAGQGSQENKNVKMSEIECDGAVEMTMTMTHSKKSNQQSLVAWTYKRERRSHDPAKKSLLKLV